MVVRKMKEKCKDAARMRREKERAEFIELSKLLPLPASITSQLDKASIIRLTSSYLRMRSAFPQGLGKNWGSLAGDGRRVASKRAAPGADCQYSSAAGLQPQQQQQQQRQHQHQVKELASMILQTLDGFVFALHVDGKIMYISETASVHLGLPQIDLTGSSIFDYIHPADHQDVYNVLNLSDIDRCQLANGGTTEYDKHGLQLRELARSFCMRMKCILPKRNAGLVCSGYKAIHCLGYLKVRQSSQAAAGVINNNNNNNNNTSCWDSYALVAVGHSLLPSASTEVKLTRHSFMFRANMDMKLYYVEQAALKVLDFEPSEMLGHSLYQFVHLADAQKLEQSHRSLVAKSQTITKYLRLMKKGGGFVWIQCYATLINNPRNTPKPQHIVGVCFVLADDHQDQSAIHCAPTLLATANDTSGRQLLNGCHLATSKKSLPSAAATQLEVTTTDPNDGASDSDLLELEFSPISIDKTTDNKLRMMHKTNKRHSRQHQQPDPANIASHHQAVKIELASQQDRPLATPATSACSCSLVGFVGSLGASRRASDDSCSVVSSLASTVASSTSSNGSVCGGVARGSQANRIVQNQYNLLPYNDNNSTRVELVDQAAGFANPATEPSQQQVVYQLLDPSSVQMYHERLPNREDSQRDQQDQQQQVLFMQYEQTWLQQQQQQQQQHHPDDDADFVASARCGRLKDAPDGPRYSTTYTSQVQVQLCPASPPHQWLVSPTNVSQTTDHHHFQDPYAQRVFSTSFDQHHQHQSDPSSPEYQQFFYSHLPEYQSDRIDGNESTESLHHYYLDDHEAQQSGLCFESQVATRDHIQQQPQLVSHNIYHQEACSVGELPTYGQARMSTF